MGLFNIFGKAKEKTESQTTDNGVAGPTYFDGVTEHIVAPKNLQSHEWRRKLKSASGNTKFRIKYFGQLHPQHPTLIVAKDDIPALVIAVEPNTGEEILIFDGITHGYNGMFCDTYCDEQKNRRADNTYRTKNGHDTFELTISTYHGVDYDDEFGSDVSDDGQIELVDGTKVGLETAKRNGFDNLQIFCHDGRRPCD